MEPLKFLYFETFNSWDRLLKMMWQFFLIEVSKVFQMLIHIPSTSEGVFFKNKINFILKEAKQEKIPF